MENSPFLRVITPPTPEKPLEPGFWSRMNSHQYQLRKMLLKLFNLVQASDAVYNDLASRRCCYSRKASFGYDARAFRSPQFKHDAADVLGIRLNAPCLCFFPHHIPHQDCLVAALLRSLHQKGLARTRHTSNRDHKLIRCQSQPFSPIFQHIVFKTLKTFMKQSSQIHSKETT